MKTLLPILAAISICGCRTTSVTDVKIVNDEAVYRLGENTVIENIQYQTEDGEWITYPSPVLFPKGFFIGKGPSDL